MKKRFLSTPREDYLRALFVLSEGGSGVASITGVAKYMGLSKSTVSERVKDLMQEKLVTESFYSDISLSEKGRRLGERLTYKHRIAEVFLNRVLKVPKTQVHAEAHKLEHALSDSVAKRLANFLGNPKVGPHGERIPQIKKF